MKQTGASNSRELIQSMVKIGSAQLVNVVMSIVRVKVLAVLLGPAGVGLLSIYNGLLGTVTQIAGLGMASSGVREIAASNGNSDMQQRVYRVLIMSHLIQGALALAVLWIFREDISAWLFDDPSYGAATGLIGFSVLLALLAAAQVSLLQGLRRIGDVGRVTVISALLGTFSGVFCVWVYGFDGLIWFIVLQPFAKLLTVWFVARDAPKIRFEKLTSSDFQHVWVPLARLGFSFMLGGLVTLAVLLLVREEIMSTLGLEAAGQFAAAWGITVTYVGFLLSAMSADFYPRLTAVIGDDKAAGDLMNDQAQLSLAIGGPALLLLIGWAPIAVNVLYTDEFSAAISLLQWQSVGNIFKLASWSMSFALVAAARPKLFLLTELSFNAVFIALVFWFLPTLGLAITAQAFLIGYVVYFALVFALVHKLHGFRPNRTSRLLFLWHVSLASGLLVLTQIDPVMGMWSSLFLAMGMGLIGVRILLAKVGDEGRIFGLMYNVFKKIGWPIAEKT